MQVWRNKESNNSFIIDHYFLPIIFQFNGTFFKCQKSFVDTVPKFNDPLKDHQKTEMITGPNGKVQETWFRQTGRINYNDVRIKRTWTVERTRDEEGKNVLKVLGLTTNRENKDGSIHNEAWVTHWFHFFKFPDQYFEIPDHCKNL